MTSKRRSLINLLSLSYLSKSITQKGLVIAKGAFSEGLNKHRICVLKYIL